MIETETCLEEGPKPAASLDETLEATRRVVANALRRPVDTVAPDARLENDLGVDSMALIETTIDLEQHFQVALPDCVTAVGSNVRTVRDLARLITTLQVEGHTFRRAP